MVHVSKGRILLRQSGLEFFLRTLCKPTLPHEPIFEANPIGGWLNQCTYFHACSFRAAITSSRWKISSGDPTVNLTVKRAGRIPRDEWFVGDPSAKRINQQLTVELMSRRTEDMKLLASLRDPLKSSLPQAYLFLT